MDLSVDFERDAEGQQKVKFDADKSGIGKTGTQFQPVVKGEITGNALVAVAFLHHCIDKHRNISFFVI